jgi:PadR family transcriptional regulator, regulatory protein PadR
MLAGEFPSDFEIMVMIAMLGLPGKAYGSNLRRKIERETEQEVSYGSLYNALDSLEQHGWLRSQVGPAPSVRLGKPQKLYYFTLEGLKRFNQTGINVQSLIDCEGYR